MKKITSILLVLTMVFTLFVGTKMFISANETGVDDTTDSLVSESQSVSELTTEPTSEPTSEPTTEPTSEPTTEPTSEPTTEPSMPSQEEVSNWFAKIITMVLDFLAKVCEILFENVLW